MGKIADIHNILVGLIERSKDRKQAAALAQLQSLIAGFQSENVALQERNLKLVADNAELQRAIATLEKRMADADEQSRKLAASSAQFVEHMGVLWRRSDKGFERNPYCAQCARPSVMTGNPPTRPPFRPEVWVCSAHHHAPGDVEPPSK